MARYREAVQWIADNDDAELGDPDEGGYIVSVILVADLFGKDANQVYFDVMTRRDRDAKAHERHIRAEEEEEARMMDNDPMYDGLL